MSDIVIKGMEMPKTCRRCIEMEIPVKCRVNEQEPITAVMVGYNRPDDCPLKELLPHGRLIDVDKLLEAEKGKVLQIKDPSDVEVFRQLYDRIANAPTVLEASEE